VGNATSAWQWLDVPSDCNPDDQHRSGFATADERVDTMRSLLARSEWGGTRDESRQTVLTTIRASNRIDITRAIPGQRGSIVGGTTSQRTSDRSGRREYEPSVVTPGPSVFSHHQPVVTDGPPVAVDAVYRLHTITTASQSAHL
jgi:hypothetical protein